MMKREKNYQKEMFCALIYVSAILIIVEPLSPCKPRGMFGGRDGFCGARIYELK